MTLTSVIEYERLAQERLDADVWRYFCGGAGTEVTLRENLAAFERIQILPRVLQGVATPNLKTRLLGTEVSAPIVVAPTAAQGLACAEGECATARAAGSVGMLMVVPTESSRRLEEVALAGAGPFWFQLYVYRDRRIAERLVRRAEASGCHGIVLTVDAPVWRSWERPHGELPSAAGNANLVEVDDANSLRLTALTWQDIGWLRSLTELPIMLKGLLRADDAVLAVEHGAAGVIVSNHGGRTLDGAAAGIDALPAIAEAVSRRIEVYIDGGIRRGSDVFKAIALGARAVLVGRPVIWGLAVDGEAGARGVLELLADQLGHVMALSGCADVDQIGPDLVRRGEE